MCAHRDKAPFLSGCESYPAILLQPEAIEAVMDYGQFPARKGHYRGREFMREDVPLSKIG
jgi:hypothetical protein